MLGETGGRLVMQSPQQVLVYQARFPSVRARAFPSALTALAHSKIDTKIVCSL